MSSLKLSRKPGRDWLTFDRSDRWGLLSLLALVTLAAAWSGVIGPVIAWARGEAIPVEVFSRVTVPELDAAGVSHGLAAYTVDLASPSAGQRVLVLIPGVLNTVLVVGACWLVIRVMGTIATGDPFDPVNIKRLRGLAALLLIGTPVVFFAHLSASGGLLGSMDLGGLAPGFMFSIPWLPLVAGMVVALLAEAFRAGAALREDVEGLV